MTTHPARPITVELVLFSALVVLAFLIRFFHLGLHLLPPAESASALAAWQLTQGQPPEWWDAPALVLATALSFVLFGASDTTARLVPVLAGTGLVAALWLYRPWLGRWPVLVSGALLALSPTAVAISRTASEENLAVLLTLLLGWGIIRYCEEENQHAPVAGVVAIAALLQLGYAGITGLMTLLLLGASYYAVRPQGVSSATPKWLSRRSQILVPFLGSFLLLGTGLFLYPGRFGLPALQAWVQHFEPTFQEFPWYHPWLLLLGYEFPVLVIGMTVASASLWRWLTRPLDPGRTTRGFLSVWALVGLTLFFLSERTSIAAMFMGVFPLTLLSGSFLGSGLSLLDRSTLKRLLTVGIPGSVGLVFFVLTISEIARAEGPPAGLRLFVAAMAAVIPAALVLAGGLTSARPQAAVSLVLLCTGLLVTVHSSSRLAFLDPWPGTPRLAGHGVTAVLDQLRLSPYTLQGREQEVNVAQDLRKSLGWYLRDAQKVAYVPRLQSGPTLLVGMEGSNIPSISDYQPRSFPLAAIWNPRHWSWSDVWRWFLLGESKPEHHETQRMVVWVRT